MHGDTDKGAKGSRRSFLPYPKTKRKESRKVIDWVRNKRDGQCVISNLDKYGRCSSGKDVHHIKNKGAGGDDTADNLVTLCRKHHVMAQLKRIPREELEILAGMNNRIWEEYIGKVPTPEDA